MKARSTIWIAASLACLLPLVYISTQQPRFSTDPELFGVILTKGYYRSWMFSFCDGRTLHNGHLEPVVIDESKRSMRYGYRIIPRYSHTDMREFFKHHPELKEAP